MSESSSRAAWQLPDEALRAEVRACERRVRRDQARMLELIAECEQRGLAASAGYRDTVAWLGGELHLSTREAGRRLELATGPAWSRRGRRWRPDRSLATMWRRCGGSSPSARTTSRTRTAPRRW